MIDIWHIDLGKPAGFGPDDVLLADEHRRASGIRDAVTRQRWMRSRIALREILAKREGCRPEDIRFERSTYGKPRLAARQAGAPSLHFSLSRSADLCLVALSDGPAIGIDVERVVDPGDAAGLAWDFCSPDELAVLTSLDGDRRDWYFHATWVRLEARAKAVGLGLQQAQIDLRRPPDPSWRLTLLHPAEGYVGMLAFKELPGAGRQSIRHHIHSAPHVSAPARRLPAEVAQASGRRWN